MKTRSVARKETQEEIRARGGYDVDQYRPKPIINREENIEKFQNKLTYGVEDPVKIYRQKKKEVKPEKPVDRFLELEKEISEREQFLNEMTSIGQGQKYNAIIKGEISQIIREMEKIDLERNIELQKRLDQHNKNNRLL